MGVCVLGGVAVSITVEFSFLCSNIMFEFLFQILMAQCGVDSSKPPTPLLFTTELIDVNSVS